MMCYPYNFPVFIGKYVFVPLIYNFLHDLSLHTRVHLPLLHRLYLNNLVLYLYLLRLLDVQKCHVLLQSLIDHYLQVE